MYNKVAGACLMALKLVSNQFFTAEMLEGLDSAIFTNDNIGLANVDLGIVEFFNADAVFFNINLKVAATDMRYVARSKLSRSLVHKKNFSLI